MSIFITFDDLPFISQIYVHGYFPCTVNFYNIRVTITVFGLFQRTPRGLNRRMSMRRVRCTILYATETGKAERFAHRLYKLFNQSFATTVTRYVFLYVTGTFLTRQTHPKDCLNTTIPANRSNECHLCSGTYYHGGISLIIITYVV